MSSPETTPAPTLPPAADEPVTTPVASAADEADAVLVAETASLPSPPAPPPQPPPVARFERTEWLPTSTAGRVAAGLSLLALTVYCVATMSLRMGGMFGPLTIDGDQAQAVWQYWRYNIRGLFPPGDFLTDYAFVMHAPPVWWAMMASLSTFMQPLLAAKIWNLVAYAAGIIATIVGVGRRSNIFIGIAAAFLLARNVDYSTIIAGGYARSFGPFLTMLFLGVFMAGRHRLALFVLVFQAALYPSVVIPCGIAYGLYTVVAGPMPLRLRRMGGMLIAGLLIIGLGKSQDISSPKWWGPLVTLEEASKLEVWGPGGRVPETPMRPISFELHKHSGRAFRLSGPIVNHRLTASVNALMPELPHVLFVCGLVVLGGIAWRRRRNGQAILDILPWQPLLLLASAYVAYFLARQLAFRLYLPYRPLQHVVPYVHYALMALMAWAITVNLLPRRRALATVVAVMLIIVPNVVVFGNGFEKGPPTYGSYAWHANFYKKLQSLPKNVLLAGDFTNTSSAPLLGHVRVFINKNLAHPFRLGFWAEAERRIMVTYKALYATDLNDVVAFAEQEHIDYLAFQTNIHTATDKRLFAPVKKPLDALFKKNRALGFALQKPLPKEAVAFRDGDTILVDMKKLAKALKEGAPANTPVPKPAVDVAVPPKK